MKQLPLGISGLSVSEFSFGTGSMTSFGNLKQQIYLLKASRDAGFTHYDTSPYYGFGMSEKALGIAFGDDPSITIASKFGIYPPKKMLKNSLYLEVLGRKAAGRIFKSLKKPHISYSLDLASRSITKSLDRLRRDYLDILYIHDPIVDQLNIQKLEAWMKMESHRVKVFGLAGNFVHDNSEFMKQINSKLILQTMYTGEKFQMTSSNTFSEKIRFVYGIFSNGRRTDDHARTLETIRNYYNQPSIIISTNNLNRLKYYQHA